MRVNLPMEVKFTRWGVGDAAPYGRRKHSPLREKVTEEFLLRW